MLENENFLLKKLLDVFNKQEWLLEKETELKKLLTVLEKVEYQKLTLELLENFEYLRHDRFNRLINILVDNVVSNGTSLIQTSQIAPLANDPYPDSSYLLLQSIKIKLVLRGWGKVKLVSKLGGTIRQFKNGKSNIFIIDEFLGSGKTLESMNKYLINELKQDYNIRYLFLAGMENTIERLNNFGLNIFCALKLKRGISDRFEFSKAEELKNLMKKIETEKLAEQINSKKLEDYSLGFNSAEALYSAQESWSNTPNSVFPIFWWPKNSKFQDHINLLSRHEEGFN